MRRIVVRAHGGPEQLGIETVDDAPRPTELQRRGAIVIDALRGGWLRIDEGTAFELDRVADAHRAIEARGTRGKLYLTP